MSILIYLLSLILLGVFLFARDHLNSKQKEQVKICYKCKLIVFFFAIVLFLLKEFGCFFKTYTDTIFSVVLLSCFILIIISWVYDRREEKRKAWECLGKRILLFLSIILPLGYVYFFPNYAIHDDQLEYFVKQGINRKHLDSLMPLLNQRIGTVKEIMDKLDASMPKDQKELIYRHYHTEIVIYKISSFTLGVSMLVALFTSFLMICIDNTDDCNKFKKALEREINTVTKPKIEFQNDKLSRIPGIFALIIALGVGLLIGYTIYHDGGLGIDGKMHVTLIYLWLFVGFSFIYKRRVDSINSKFHPYLNGDYKNASKRKTNILKLAQDNPYQRESRRIKNILTYIDMPMAVSFTIFFVFYYAIYLDSSSGSYIYKFFGYGGTSLHVFTATVIFLYEYAEDFFNVPMPKIKE